jgi:hypothetical protein
VPSADHHISELEGLVYSGKRKLANRILNSLKSASMSHSNQLKKAVTKLDETKIFLFTLLTHSSHSGEQNGNDRIRCAGTA